MMYRAEIFILGLRMAKQQLYTVLPCVLVRLLYVVVVELHCNGEVWPFWERNTWRSLVVGCWHATGHLALISDSLA